MSNIAYYQRRELEEMRQAASASDPKVRAIHEKLARQYAHLARQQPAKPVVSIELMA